MKLDAQESQEVNRYVAPTFLDSKPSPSIGQTPRIQFYLAIYLVIWCFNISFIDLGTREEGRERERNVDLLFHLLVHSLVASCMCPDQRLNLQPWHIRDDTLTH